jgi:hypothetical protein
MRLGWLGRRHLLRDGYVQLKGVVPPGRVEAALRVINRSLGEQGMPPDKLREMRARTYCEDVVSAPEILALYASTGARAAAQSAIGPVRTPDRGQIALRFPQAPPAPRTVPHIDGLYTPDNGVPAGALHHFTALMGVFLSDVTTAEAGNFVVWPGSHRMVEEQIRRHGPGSLAVGLPTVELPPPRPLLARAGDVVISHYALAHAAAPNLGPSIRYAVFFRLFHADHEKMGDRTLTSLWLEWEGMPRRQRRRVPPTQ